VSALVKLALHLWRRADRSFTDAGSHPDPAICDWRSSWSCISYVRLLPVCSSYLRVGLIAIRSHVLRTGELHLFTRMTTVFRSCTSIQSGGALLMSPRGRNLIGSSLIYRLTSLIIRGICSPSRCWPIPNYMSAPLRHYFTAKNPTGHNLLPRAHSFALPSKDSRNFMEHCCKATLSRHVFHISSFLLISCSDVFILSWAIYL